MSWVIGLTGSMLVAGVAYVARSLSFSGAVASILVGTVMFGAGSLPWYGVLLVFFLTSSGWSKYKRQMKHKSEESYEKTGRRDAGQVVANGGIGVLLCLCAAWFSGEFWWIMFVGVMASVTADTWATEIGSLSPSPPRSICNGQRVEAGASGGVTLLGLSAAVLGAITIGLSAWLFCALTGLEEGGGWLLCAAACGGFFGALVDSWLGARWQRMNRCTKCGKTLEATIHCGQPTSHMYGYRWMNNDVVNGISSGLGGLITWIVYRIGEGL